MMENKSSSYEKEMIIFIIILQKKGPIREVDYAY